jgi:hypothetical protein
MELPDREPLGENDTLARHIRLAEVLERKRLLEWDDLKTLIYDSSCLTPQGKRVAVSSIAILKEFLKDKFLVNAQHAPEILTIHPFFALNFFPGVNDVPRVYADVLRLALQLHLLQSLERFGGILRSLSRNLEAVQWYHTLLQFEVASLAQKKGWQVQLELPYNNGTNNKSDVCLSKEETQLLIDAVSIRMSENGRKKKTYDNWLAQMSIQYGINITGRIGEPWIGTREEELQWVQNVQKTLFSVYRSGIFAVVYSPNGGSLEFSRAAYGKTGMANIHDADINEDSWDRIRRALGEKNKQAFGNIVWLRMGEYAGLWHWSRYRNMTLEEKLSNLSPMIQTALEGFPNIAGVILSPGILPVYHPEVQMPGKFSSVDGSIALRCSLLAHCVRESIIIPRRGMDADAFELMALYEHEETWLDWALAQAGHPPFHTLVQEL